MDRVLEVPPSIILDVVLDPTTTPPTAVVPDAAVRMNTVPQLIMWRLVGDNTAKAKFTRLFWLSPRPPRDIFGPFIPGYGGKWATMTDFHRDGSTANEWVYRLEVQVGRKKYRCQMHKPIGSGTPTIRNT